MNYDVQPNYNADNKVNFRNDALQQFVIDRGAPFQWERSYLCTCRSETGSAKIDCPICGGTGIAYLKPIEVVGMIQSMTAGSRSTETGIANPGTSLFTTTEEDDISFRDRLTFPKRLVPISIMVKVTSKSLVHGINLRYKVEKVTNAVYGYPSPTVIDPDVISMSINKESSILTPTKEMLGSYLSLNMLVSLRFYVVDVLHDGRYQFEKDPRRPSSKITNLPRQLVVTREDMYVPPILENDGKVTSVENDPKAKLSNNRTEGFFNG